MLADRMVDRLDANMVVEMDETSVVNSVADSAVE